MKNKIKEELKALQKIYIVYYLIFSKDISKDLDLLKSDISDYIFLDVIDAFINEILIQSTYPKKCYINFEKILEYIKNIYKDKFSINVINGIIKKYAELKDKLDDSYEIYNSEFLKKHADLELTAKHSAYVWNIDDIEDSIAFDCSMILNLDTPMDKYLSEVVPDCIYSQNFLRFIKKIISDGPILLTDPNIKSRILSVLEINRVTLEHDNYEELVQTFILKNEGIEITDIKAYSDSFEQFILENNNLEDKIRKMNRKNYEDNFDISKFITYYYQRFLEKQLIDLDLKKINSDNLFILEVIYKLIKDNHKIPLYTEGMKKNIIEIMDIYRQKYGKSKEFVQKYNDYLVMLNGTEISQSIIAYLGMIKCGKSGFKQLIDEDFKDNTTDNQDELLRGLIFDFRVINSFVCDDKKYETYKQYFKYCDEYIETITKFFKELPDMFDNKTIYNRTTEVLKLMLEEYKNIDSPDYYKKGSKILKLINKHYGDKM